MNKKNIFQYIKAASFIGLGIFFIFFFWNKLEKEQQSEIIENFFKANFFWIFVSIIIGILSHLLRAARWNLLIETIDKPPTLANSFWAVMSGYLANLAVPRLGEVTRVAILSKQNKISFDKLLGTVVAERAFDFIFYVLLFFISIIAFWFKIESYVKSRFLDSFNEKMNFVTGWNFVFILCALVAFFLLFLWIINKFKHIGFIGKIRKVFFNILNGFLTIFKLKHTFLFFVYTFLMWLMYWLAVYVIFFSINTNLQSPAEAAFLTLIFGTIGIILIQGGIGIYPLIVSEVLLIYGLSVTYGYTIGWISWSVQTIVVLILGMFAFIVINFKNKNKNGLSTNNTK